MAPELLIYIFGYLKYAQFWNAMIKFQETNTDHSAFPFLSAKEDSSYAHSPDGEALGKIHHFQVKRSF